MCLRNHSYVHTYVHSCLARGCEISRLNSFRWLRDFFVIKKKNVKSNNNCVFTKYLVCLLSYYMYILSLGFPCLCLPIILQIPTHYTHSHICMYTIKRLQMTRRLAGSAHREQVSHKSELDMHTYIHL